ncbi:hypothetical protein [Lacibacter sp.]|nr:hypothetical protein [Lacibacter sp.]HLP35658.1 hypothetical protein [Lacibacter sp.]
MKLCACPSLIIHYSSLIIHHSSLIIHHSSLIIHHSSPFKTYLYRKSLH